MRKLAALLMCAVVFICSGCSAGKPLTPSEYKVELQTIWEKWCSNTTGCVMLIPADNDDPQFFEKLGQNYPEAKEYFKVLEECYSDFEILVPPEEYREYQRDIVVGVKHERVWLGYIKQLFESDDMQEFNEIADKITEQFDSIAGSGTYDGETLPSAYARVYLKLKEDGVE